MTFFGGALSPNASRGESIDWSDALGSGVTIQTSNWLVRNGTEADKTLASPITTIEVTVTNRMKPVIAVNRITTSDGQTLERSITLPSDAT